MTVMQNYMERKEFLDEVDDNDKTDVGSTAAGFYNQLDKFQTCFSRSSQSKVFAAIGSVNQTMQASDLHAVVPQTAAEFRRFVATTMLQEPIIIVLDQKPQWKPPISVQMYPSFEMIGN